MGNLQHHFNQFAPPQIGFNPYMPAFHNQQQGLLGAAPPGFQPGLLPAPAPAAAAGPPEGNNREQLLALARQMADSGESENGKEGDEDDGISEDEDEGDGELSQAEIKKKIADFQRSALENPDSLFNPGSSESNVMGDEYLEAPLTIPGFCEQEILKAEATMHSQDKKRQMRILKTINFHQLDLGRALARGPGMLPIERLVKRWDRDGHAKFAKDWMASQMLIKSCLDNLRREIRHEVAMLELANDKSNRHGFGTIERMRSLQRMESTVPKELLDLYNRASSSMDKLKTAKKRGGGGGGRGGTKRRRPNPKQKPNLPACAVCGIRGHAAGDAACKAAKTAT